jgi:CDGSH-type Zn-finger protein
MDTRGLIEPGKKAMTEPVIAQKSPYAVEVEAGKTYYWCSCGRSAKQPFCDGSHKGTEFVPLAYRAEKAGTVYFCGCKHSGTKPLCDGAHSKL